MRVTPIPCLSDNYSYLIQPDDGPDAIVVDASSAEPVIRTIEGRGARPVALLTTHHHFDHVGGNLELVRRYPGLTVFGHASGQGRIPGLNHPLEDGDGIEVAGLDAVVLHVPGHTRDALAYRFGSTVFTGDTLFVAGCGRLFEGTAQQMYRSLNEKLAKLGDETQVYPGHEYTRNNLEFALSIEPTNARARDKLERVIALRARAEPSVPSSIGEERETNPFLRVTSPQIVARLGLRPEAVGDPVSVFAAVRAAKDRF